ncbi:SEL1-like repeat protein [Candidatus Berkiella aquae]|uniref:Sel1 repeat protein n=1 Tax=Candidatus Berkiella aquae TaxID=295108 RepID=A0A0Q9YX45_9GAMM|nr:SEL1-like repeat protein [Candidatus Berkiella aquae]MCS5710704.1 hypothetical protein [Candidatus Berkiella aquae]
MPSQKRNKVISQYLATILDEYSQKVFDSEENTLSHFYLTISGMMFEKEGFLAQAFLCYQSSTHPFSRYSCGYFYEHGIGGAKKKLEKAHSCYAEVKEQIKEANTEEGEINDEDSPPEAKTSSDEQFELPTIERAAQIDAIIQNAIRSHSQKIHNNDFHQLLIGLLYEKLGYPIQAFLLYKKVDKLTQASYAMGYFYEKGLGVPCNIEKAKKYYQKANALNLPKAESAHTTSDLQVHEVLTTDTDKSKEILPNAQISEITKSLAVEPAISEVVTPIVPERDKSPKTLLFSANQLVPKATAKDELKTLGERFHSLRSKEGITQAELLPSYLGMMRILETRAKAIDEKLDSPKENLIRSCCEMIKLDKKFPLQQFAGDIAIDDKIQLQFYKFKAHYYLSKHALENDHREAHRKQAIMEAKHYCELTAGYSTAASQNIKNYYAQNVFYNAIKELVKNRYFSQTMVSLIALGLARIHRNGGGTFFQVFAKERFCSIQSYKLALDLMQSALTVAKDRRPRDTTIREINFMKTTFAKEVKTIQENNPDIVNTSREPIKLSPKESEEKLFALLDNYFITIEALFSKDLFEAIPHIMRNVHEYLNKEQYLEQSIYVLTDAARDIDQVMHTQVQSSQGADETKRTKSQGVRA